MLLPRVCSIAAITIKLLQIVYSKLITMVGSILVITVSIFLFSYRYHFELSSISRYRLSFVGRILFRGILSRSIIKVPLFLAVILN